MMHVKFYTNPVEGKGLGVFANEFIPKDTLVWKLTEAKRLTKEEYYVSSEDVKKNAYPEGNHYVPSDSKGESWNHSCDANTWWTADDELSARRDI
jgi:hypothetical protein